MATPFLHSIVCPLPAPLRGKIDAAIARFGRRTHDGALNARLCTSRLLVQDLVETHMEIYTFAKGRAALEVFTTILICAALAPASYPAPLPEIPTA